MSDTQYGGQAVLEGVMMRGKEDIAIAVRKAPDDIVLKKLKVKSIGDKFPFLKWPFIRGIVALISSMMIGIRSLTFSASQVAEEEEEEISPLEMVISIVVAFGFAILLFVILPASIISLLQPYIENNIILNLTEGIIKIIAFLTYLFVISRLNDIKRVFMYHGAEHKVVHYYEGDCQGDISSYSRLHKRCGSNIVFYYLIISLSTLFVYIPLNPYLLELLFLGIAYEAIKYTPEKLLFLPYLFQRIVTREPEEKHIRAAKMALDVLLERK